MNTRFTTDAHRLAEQTLPQESPRTNWGIEAWSTQVSNFTKNRPARN